MNRRFSQFNHKEANLRLWAEAPGLVDLMIQTIIRERAKLDAYIDHRPLFRDSFSPLPDIPGPGERVCVPVVPLPQMAEKMLSAARRTGLGPMAAVAGAFSQAAVEAVQGAGTGGMINPDAVCENGGDIYMHLTEEMYLGIYPGEGPLAGKLAFRIKPEETPLSLCSSSGKMGHSRSFGRCDLATVASEDGCLADAAATLAANLVKTPADITDAVNRLMKIEGVRGVLIICEGQIGLGGALPEIVKCSDPGIKEKITRDLHSQKI